MVEDPVTKKPIVLEKMLQAKARHDDHKVEEIERDQALLERAAKLEANNGMDHKPAIAIALKM